jgi:hypothetical protein
MLKDIIIHILSSIKFDALFYTTKLADGLIIKTNNGKYYLDKEKLAQAKAQLNSKKSK